MTRRKTDRDHDDSVRSTITSADAPGRAHDRKNPPAVLVGGANGNLKGNRHVVAKDEEPTANLLLAMAHLGGVEIDKLGASTGRLDL